MIALLSKAARSMQLDKSLIPAKYRTNLKNQFPLRFVLE